METNKSNIYNNEDANDRLAEIADALAEGRAVDFDQLIKSGELTTDQVRALRALHAIHQVQIGDVALEGEAPELAVIPSRFEYLQNLLSRDGDRIVHANDRLLGQPVFVREIYKTGDSDKWNEYVKTLKKLMMFDHPLFARVLDVEERWRGERGLGARLVIEAAGAQVDTTKIPNPADLTKMTLGIAGVLAELESRGYRYHSVSPKGILYNKKTNAFILADYADPPPRTVVQTPAVANLGNCIFNLCAGRAPTAQSESLAAVAPSIPPGFVKLIDRARGAADPHFEQCAPFSNEVFIYLQNAEGKRWVGGAEGRLRAIIKKLF